MVTRARFVSRVWSVFRDYHVRVAGVEAIVDAELDDIDRFAGPRCYWRRSPRPSGTARKCWMPMSLYSTIVDQQSVSACSRPPPAVHPTAVPLLLPVPSSDLECRCGSNSAGNQIQALRVWPPCRTLRHDCHKGVIMKLATIALGAAFAMPASFAFAQAGEGDAGFSGGAGGGYGGWGYQGGAYAAYPGAYGAVPDVYVAIPGVYGGTVHPGRMGRNPQWDRRSYYRYERR